MLSSSSTTIPVRWTANCNRKLVHQIWTKGRTLLYLKNVEGHLLISLESLIFYPQPFKISWTNFKSNVTFVQNLSKICKFIISLFTELQYQTSIDQENGKKKISNSGAGSMLKLLRSFSCNNLYTPEYGISIDEITM